MASAIQIDAAARDILSAATSAEMAAPTSLKAAAIAPADFCGLWKQAKPVLETAATILTFFAPAVAGTLRGLIKIGDQIATGMGCT